MGKEYVNNMQGLTVFRKTVTVTTSGGAVTTTVTNNNSLTWLDNLSVQTGSNGADWEQKLARGMLTGSMDVTAQSRRLEEQGGIMRSVRRTSDGQTRVCYLESSYSGTSFAAVPAGDTYAKAYNSAATTFIGRLKGTQQAMLLAAVGEGRESAKTLVDYARKLVAAILGFRTNVKKALVGLLKKFVKTEKKLCKRDRKRRKSTMRRWSEKSSKMLANEWLAFSYGLKPLLSDIDGLLDAQFSGKIPERRKVSSSGSYAISAIKAPVSFLYDSGTTLYTQQTSSAIRTTVVKLLALLRQPLSETAAKQQRFGTGLDDFIPTLWELVPWSFLVDSATNVGEIITAHSYFAVNPTDAQITVYSEILQTSTAGLLSKPAPAGWVLIGESSRPSKVAAKTVTISRGRILNPVPGMELSFDPSTFQVLSLSSLAVLKGLKLLDSQWAAETKAFLAGHPSIGPYYGP